MNVLYDPAVRTNEESAMHSMVFVEQCAGNI